MNTKKEQLEWSLGARNCKSGLSLTQSYKHIDHRDYDLRTAHKTGWIAMRDFIELKEIYEND